MQSGYLITIDGGTTNTRACLWKEQEIIACAFRAIGVRNNAASDNRTPLVEAVRDCLEEILGHCGISFQDVTAVVASGMLTSAEGLVEIPHLTAPVDARKLAASMKQVTLPEVCPLPIWFIPGIKNPVAPVTEENFEQMDMMRGEETEVFGVLKDVPAKTPVLFVMPGSHNKFVFVNEAGEVTGCMTTISGELLSVITQNTILSSSVKKHFVSEDTYCSKMLFLGAEASAKNGIARACFEGRILANFAGKDETDIANYLLGVILQGDVDVLKKHKEVSGQEQLQIFVAGKNPLRKAMVDILKKENPDWKVNELLSKKGYPMSAIGAKHLYELGAR